MVTNTLVLITAVARHSLSGNFRRSKHPRFDQAVVRSRGRRVAASACCGVQFGLSRSEELLAHATKGARPSPELASATAHAGSDSVGLVELAPGCRPISPEHRLYRSPPERAARAVEKAARARGPSLVGVLALDSVCSQRRRRIRKGRWLMRASPGAEASTQSVSARY
jgi:hypothetical protein